MKSSRLFAPIVTLALGLAALNFLNVTLWAEDPVPPVPPGSTLPPPLPSKATPTPPSTASAQTATPGSNSQLSAHANGRLEKLTKELHLTSAQVAKIKPIFESARQRIKALRGNAAVSATQKQQQIRQIFVSSFQQIRPILTSQQLQKWKQIRDEHPMTAART